MTDDEALAQFEAFVLAQKPAETPWSPVTDYSFEARKEIEGIHPQLIKDVFQPKRVLDAGCGPNGHLVRLLRESGVHAYGCDVNLARALAWDRVPIMADALKTCDISISGIAHPFGWSDLVVCREVLEHLTLRQLRRAVTNLCEFSYRFVYVTTRFAKNPAHVLSVDTSDNLDPTHISMTNQAWLRHLFVLEGFRRRADLESQLDWKNLGRCLVYERAA